MHESKTILVPIDFSDCALSVVERATKVAGDQGAALLLLHVAQLPDGIDADTPLGPDDRDRRSAGQVLREEAQGSFPVYVAAATEGGVIAATRIEHGPPADTILRVARDLDVSTIVIGTHGRTGLSRLMLGSVSEQVVKQASCPVMTVRTQYKPKCQARSCAWCATHITDGQSALRAELDG